MLILIDSGWLIKHIISVQIDAMILGFKLARKHPEAAEFKDLFKIKSEEYGKENATPNA